MHTRLIALHPPHNCCNHTLGPAFTIPQFKIFLVFFFFSQSLKVKKMMGTEILGLTCSFLCYTESQKDRPTWSGGEGWDTHICCTEESKIVPSFPTQQIPKCASHTHTHTRIYTRYPLTSVFNLIYKSIFTNITYVITSV